MTRDLKKNLAMHKEDECTKKEYWRIEKLEEGVKGKMTKD